MRNHKLLLSIISLVFCTNCTHSRVAKPTLNSSSITETETVTKPSRENSLKKFIGDSGEYEDWQRMRKSVNWSDLRAAYDMTKVYLKKYPDSDHAKQIHAVMWGDYSELLNAEEERQTKVEVTKVLFELMKNLGRYPLLIQSNIRNEYYYHSNQFLNQYLLGRANISGVNTATGHFSTGVGGSEHAFMLLQQGDIKGAKKFADESVQAWEKHAKLQPGWAYPYPYFYLQAIAITGDQGKLKKVWDVVEKRDDYNLKRQIYDKYRLRLKVIAETLATERSSSAPK